MVKPLAICIEDLDAVSDASRYLRCVALPGRQPGLRLDETGAVLWQAGEILSCELWVSADDRLILYRQDGMAPALLRRGERSLDVPHGKPVVVLDKDEINIGPRRLRIHVHGEAAAVAAPSPLPSRSPLAGRLAQTVATAALLGAVASAGGCSESEPTRLIEVTREIEVRQQVPEIAMVVTDVTTAVASPDPVSIRATQSPVDRRFLLGALLGDYISAGRDWEGRLTIRPDATYAFVRKETSGAEHHRDGQIVVADGALWFDKSGPDSAALIPVAWGERRYLVEANALGRFCSPESGEPRTTREGTFYLREGDWSRPTEGAPTLLDGRPACP